MCNPKSTLATFHKPEMQSRPANCKLMLSLRLRLVVHIGTGEIRQTVREGPKQLSKAAQPNVNDVAADQ